MDAYERAQVNMVSWSHSLHTVIQNTEFRLEHWRERIQLYKDPDYVAASHITSEIEALLKQLKTIRQITGA